MSKLADYELGKLISNGGTHSEVYRAAHLETDTQVAIKRIKIFDLHAAVRKEVDTEISLLQKLDHPNLIQYHEHFHHESDLYIVMELAIGGQMAHKVEAVRKTSVRIEEKLLWGWLNDVASGLAYLHSRRVLHRDVKPSHIFLGDDGQAKLGDFGLSKVMSAKTQIAFSCVGTPFYMSPELVKGEGYAFGSDVWSLGCSIYELAAGYPPFFRADMDFYALGDAICSARYPALAADNWSREFIAVIADILAVDPRQRPTAQKILDVAVCARVGRIQEFELLGTIGRGKFSEVHRALRKAGTESSKVALKRVQIFEMDSEARKDCIIEVNLLKSLNHLTIVRYLDSFTDNNELVIVLELAPHGDLAGLCRCLKESDRSLTETQVWATIFQVSDAMHYMHKKRIMHRDIKPANVFLCSQGVVKLGDLGLGRYFSSNTYRAHSVVGTPFYMSPEVINNSGGSSGGYSFKSDIWSLGCVLYELAALQSPFACSRLNYYALGKQICSGEYPALPDSASRNVQKLCAEMIKVNPEHRPNSYAVFVATDEHFSNCIPAPSPSAEDAAPRAEATGESCHKVHRVHTQLMRAAGVVRGTLEALGMKEPSGGSSTSSSAVGAPPWSAGSSAYPSQNNAYAGSAAAYARSSSFPEATPSSARRTTDRPPPAVTVDKRNSSPRERSVANATVPKRPERAPPYTVPTPPGVPPPQPFPREDGTSSVGYQSHVVRRRPVPAPGGSLSARGSSRERQHHDSMGHASRRARTPERGRQQPPTQVSHLRFAGGGISEVWKAQGNLPPIKQRTPRESSREAHGYHERGATTAVEHAERGGRTDAPPQRELAGAPPPMPPSARVPVTTSADEQQSSPSKRLAPRGPPPPAAPIPPAAAMSGPATGTSSEAASLRLPGATASMRAH
jgi:NIMA (never in mitosis gene a)-related kinase